MRFDLGLICHGLGLGLGLGLAFFGLGLGLGLALCGLVNITALMTPSVNNSDLVVRLQQCLTTLKMMTTCSAGQSEIK